MGQTHRKVPPGAHERLDAPATDGWQTAGPKAKSIRFQPGTRLEPGAGLRGSLAAARGPGNGMSMAQTYKPGEEGGYEHVDAQGRVQKITFPRLEPVHLEKNGIIVQAPHFVPLMDNRIQDKDAHHARSVHGDLCVKLRWLVSICIFEDHILALPVTTHSGHGLSNLSAQLANEHVGLTLQGKEFPKPGRYPPLEILKTGGGTWAPNETAYVHLTVPFSVSIKPGIGAREVGYCGRLTGASFKQLYDLFMDMVQEQVVKKGKGNVSFKEGKVYVGKAVDTVDNETSLPSPRTITREKLTKARTMDWRSRTGASSVQVAVR